MLSGSDTSTEPRYHMAYLTANDGRDFSIDFLNFRQMTLWSPGVPRVEITIVVSQVRPFTEANVRQVDALVRCAMTVPWLHVRAVVWKGNIGRDFSSAEAGLRSMTEEAADDDFILVRNRSAYGPFSKDWYTAYVEQFGRDARTGLVGTTINLTGPSNMPAQFDPRHVQTYVYLSRWRYLAPLIGKYPGRNCMDNPGAILHGELGLNRYFMDGGFGISCLYWSEYLFTKESADDPELPRTDIKSSVSGMPFRYKFPAYRRSSSSLLRRTVWVIGTYWPWRRTSGTSGYRVYHMADYGVVQGSE